MLSGQLKKTASLPLAQAVLMQSSVTRSLMSLFHPHLPPHPPPHHCSQHLRTHWQLLLPHPSLQWHLRLLYLRSDSPIQRGKLKAPSDRTSIISPLLKIRVMLKSSLIGFSTSPSLSPRENYSHYHPMSTNTTRNPPP